MVLSKKLLAMLLLITTVLLLASCSDKESSGDIGPQDGPQDGSPVDILPLSEALEEYSVWIETRANPSRTSGVRGVFVFEKGEVTKYDLNGSTKLEDILDFSDEEIIQLASENTEPQYFGEYTLDITIDEYGQNTKSIKLETQKTKEAEEAAGYKEAPEYKPITFYTDRVEQRIFETTFSGFITYRDHNGPQRSLVTRVNSDSPIFFDLDKPDTDKKNVTIEGK